MKHSIALSGLLFFGLMATTFTCAQGAKESGMTSKQIRYDSLWQKYSELQSQGLTQSAIDLAGKIYTQAKAASNHSEMVRALLADLSMTAQKQEDAYVKAIERLESEIEKSCFPETPVLRVLLAEHYWQYYQQNRWQFYDRTQTVNFEIKDIHTWDLKTLFEKTLLTYRQSLTDAERLKKLPLSTYSSVITSSYEWEKLRPTIYDIVAHRALDFYKSEEPDIIRPASTFELDCADYFKPYSYLIKMELATKDTNSLKFHALRTMRDLLAFHATDPEPDALIDADLERLKFVRQYSTLPDKDDLYADALKSLERAFSHHTASAEVTCLIAGELAERAALYTSASNESARWLYKKVLALCDQTINKFPKSYGAQNCAVLKASIINKSLTFEVERVNMPLVASKALVQYRNLSTIHVRMIKLTPADSARVFRHTDDWTIEKTMEAMARLKPLHAWSVQLPDAGDYQPHSAEIEIPAADIGRYLVLVSTARDFNWKDNVFTYGLCWNSHIGFMSREQPAGLGAWEYYVFDRQSGTPLAGVTATVNVREYNYKKREYIQKRLGAFVSDAEGRFKVPPPSKNKDGREFSIEFEKQGDWLGTENERYQSYNSPDASFKETRTFFFTDRALYRPGQTVYFKGVMLVTDGKKSRIAPRQKTSVRFHDVNGREVSKLDLGTNEFGSFHGCFTAPVNVLNGQMSIENGTGECSFSVEEYKRPKFEVTIMPAGGAFRLNDMVTVEGIAKAYAGSAIDGAKVKYRVVREVRYPYWGCWWRPIPSSPAMEIANGATMTGSNGEFSVKFKALPDFATPKQDNPIFTYTVFADVTDINGETRSATGLICLAYTALNLTLDIPEAVNRDATPAFGIAAATMSGVVQTVKGSVEVYRLRSPQRVVRSRIWNEPDTFIMTQEKHDSAFAHDCYRHESDMGSWEKQERLFQVLFDTHIDQKIAIDQMKNWPQGAYVAEAKTKDAFGAAVTIMRYFSLYSPMETLLPYAKTDWFTAVKSTCEPGEKAVFMIGSGYENTRILYEVEHQGAVVEKKWLRLSNRQQRIEIPIEEKHRGNLAVHFTFVKQNRSYQRDEIVTVPWSNKALDIRFETFRSKLLPGEKEEWRLKISGPGKDKSAAEMVASLYDASLDAFRPHAWNFSIYPNYGPGCTWDITDGFLKIENANVEDHLNPYPGSPASKYYSEFSWDRYSFNCSYYGGGQSMVMSCAAPMKMEERSSSKRASKDNEVEDKESSSHAKVARRSALAPSEKEIAGEKPVNLAQVHARSNLNETAFFFPDLRTDAVGAIIVKFTMPEALTKWKMLGFAHSKDLKFGFAANELVTQKELMVMPNPPRFFRENDRIAFSAKITNLSEEDVSGEAQLFLFDPSTGKSLDRELRNLHARQTVSIKKGLSAPLFWKLEIPEGLSAVQYKVVAQAGRFSDGEEQILPVLSNRMLVTETFPLPIRKKETRHYTFEKLTSQNQGSKTLQNHKLTLEFTSNPAWYAVQALPYLMEYPYECAEQTFARYYANSIAAHIANASPAIKKTFETWKTASSDALLSNLEKNRELKSLMLEETPWVLEGKDESERKKRVALLFDLNKMAREQSTALAKLQKMQIANGGWPWFEGMPDDRYITQYIITGLGRLGHISIIDMLGEDIAGMTQSAVPYLDDRIKEDYDNIMRHDGHPELNHLGEIQVQYLYMRGFFNSIPLQKKNKPAFDYFLGQARKYWLSKTRYLQGMLALALNRQNDKVIPMKIMRSLKENALSSEEMGMYWKEMYENGWYWYQAPIETEALMIEAFDEVAGDKESVEEMKVWLLKSKQTQNWETTKATTEAVYALILRGADWLARDPGIRIQLGDIVVDPKKIKTEAGTGYFKTSWSDQAIDPNMGKIIVTKDEPGVAWGALYWQYFEQLDKITSHETPLKLNRKLFRQMSSDEGLKLEPVTAQTRLKPGDKLMARIELRVDRDMEYVHMKDMRASGFEPLNVISGYKYQDGLGYYESTRDAATNFFFSQLGKGTYVFEYPMVVTHNGDFSNGVTTIQCMYAPEFSSHSEGLRVKVADK